MAINKLCDRKVAKAGEGKYEDGGGLRLVVSATGAKKWVFRFTINGKRREMGLGPYPTITLQNARQTALECRRKVYAGQDPIESKKETAKYSEDDSSILVLALEWALSKPEKRNKPLEKDSPILKRALKWALSDDAGMSSMAICRHMAGLNAEYADYPRDVGDLGRCLRLLEEVPEWKGRMHEMAKYGPVWQSLSERWEELAELMEEESGIDFSKKNKAQRTAAALFKAISEGAADQAGS